MRVPYFGKPPYAQVSKIEASDEANWQDSPKRVDQVPGADADWQHRWRRDSTAFRRLPQLVRDGSEREAVESTRRCRDGIDYASKILRGLKVSLGDL